MNIRILVSIPCVMACGLLASCGSTPVCGNPHPYLQAQTRGPLVAPPGLTLPAPDSTYLIPPAGTKAPAATAAPSGGCIVAPPDVLPAAATAAAQPAAAPVARPAAAPAPAPASGSVAKPAPAASTAHPPVAVGGGME